MGTSPFIRDSKRKVCDPSSVGEPYIFDKKIYLEFVQTGTDEKGKAIGSIKPVVKTTKRNVDDLVMSHAKECGIKNIIDRYFRTGDSSLFNACQPLPDGDYSNYTDLKTPEEIYSTLPEDLKAGRTYEEFLNSLTPDQIKAFLKSLENKDSNSSEVNDDVK